MSKWVYILLFTGLATGFLYKLHQNVLNRAIDAAVTGAVAEYSAKQLLAIDNLKKSKEQMRVEHDKEIQKVVAEAKKALDVGEMVNCSIAVGSDAHRLLKQAATNHTIALSSLQTNNG